MQRLVFEVGGHLVRLSANICQLHRPNTIPIFCAAVCRDYRLRTFIAIAFKFLCLRLLNLYDCCLLHRDAAVFVAAELYDHGVIGHVDNYAVETAAGQYP